MMSKITRRKPRLLIIGHGSYGKDTVAEMLSTQLKLGYLSTSKFVGVRFIWPVWGKERYSTFAKMFADRSNHRVLWGNFISAYNTPDKVRTATEMLETKDCDMCVGIRKKDEYTACINKRIFDHVIWVDASGRLPNESRESSELTASNADILIDNNGPISGLKVAIDNLQIMLHKEGYEVNYTDKKTSKNTSKKISKKTPEKTPELSWEDKPEHAIQVLDHGFFRVDEVMGSDSTIAASARMSYGRGTKKINDDRGLINYLVHNKHTSPLEMGEIRFHMRLPIFVMRQLVRHRTANLNEYSGRYSEMVELFYIPDLKQIKKQGKVNKQGSGDPLPDSIARAVQGRIESISSSAFAEYQALLRDGVSRETARMVLPLNTYTECVWKLDVSNLIKFLYLRDDDHAQWEIREYAIKIAEAVEYYFPLVYAAYKVKRNSVNLNENQVKALMLQNVKGLPKGEAKTVTDIIAHTP